jgi:hypothetical protein
METLLEKVMKKLLKVIESTTKLDHIEGTRRYIDLYYKQYGELNKGIIELYFKKQIKLIKQR